MDLARNMREYISDLCRLVNKSHLTYTLNDNDTLKMPGGYVKKIIIFLGSKETWRPKKRDYRDPIQCYPT